MEEAIGHRDIKKESIVKMYSIFMLFLSIPILNPVNLLGAGLCFITLRQSYAFWKDYWKLIKFFYGSSLAATIIQAGGLFIYFVRIRRGLSSLTAEELVTQKFNSEIVIIMFVLCVAEVFCVVKTYKALLELYTEFESSPDILLNNLTGDESNLK